MSKRTIQISVLIVAILVVIGLLVVQPAVGERGEQQSEAVPTENATTTSATTSSNETTRVQTLATDRVQSDNTITVSGEVQAQLRATISSQTSGVVQSVSAEIGERVSRGSVLARFENSSQQAAVRQARASVEQQKARLDQLIAGARPLEVENSRLSAQTARTSLQQARTNLFNTDLQAYVAEGESAVRSGTLQPPTITGTYEGNERGEYRITLYRSGSKSGYSFRYSGLESGVGTVSTETPQPLGNRGLYIQFPDNFAKNKLLTWVVPVPNTRSGQYSSAQTNFEQARTQFEQAQNNLQLSQEGARTEEVRAARAQLNSAQANLASAEAQLEKTAVRAPFSGTILSISTEAGEYVGAGQSVARIIDESSSEIRAFVSPETARRIMVGDTAAFNGNQTARVIAVAPAVSDQNGNVEVRLQPVSNTRLTAGTYVDVTFQPGVESDGSNLLPLSAVGTTASGAYVLVVDNENTLQRESIRTGDVSGSQIKVLSPLPNQPIVRDISGLSAGQAVTTVDDE